MHDVWEKHSHREKLQSEIVIETQPQDNKGCTIVACDASIILIRDLGATVTQQ